MSLCSNWWEREAAAVETFPIPLSGSDGARWCDGRWGARVTWAGAMTTWKSYDRFAVVSCSLLLQQCSAWKYRREGPRRQCEIRFHWQMIETRTVIEARRQSSEQPGRNYCPTTPIGVARLLSSWYGLFALPSSAHRGYA